MNQAPFLAGMLLLAACSSSSSSSSSPSTSTPPSAAEPTDNTADAGLSCNAVAQLAEKATLHMRTESEPAPMGGALADGTFVLTEVTRYDLAVAEDDREYLDRVTMRFSNGVAELVATRTIAGQETVRRSRSTITTSGAELAAEDVCPEPHTSVFDYTVSGDSFDLFGTFLGSRMVQHFVRVPES